MIANDFINLHGRSVTVVQLQHYDNHGNKIVEIKDESTS